MNRLSDVQAKLVAAQNCHPNAVQALIAEALNALDASIRTEAAVQAEREGAVLVAPEECPHMITFDDTERAPINFAGAGARTAALKTWEQVSVSWNAHLYVCVAHNSRDCRYPVARLTHPPQASATVPEGYALVPVEPTSAMLDRAVALMLNVKVSSAYTWTQYARDLWETMLAASQPDADKAQAVAS